MASIVSQRLKFPNPTESERTSTLEPKKIDKKILIIGLEGLSFDFIIPLISQGKLPNFSWLVESGSWGRLESFSPNEPPILNSSFDTGKFPSQHRQVSPFLYSLPTTGQTFEVVPRFLLFRQWLRFGLLKISPRPPEFRPTDIWQVFQENGTSYLKSTWPAERSEGRPDAKAESAFGRFFKEFEADNTRSVGILKSAFFADWTCEEMASEERSRTQPQIFYLLLNGLNAVEAFFYKYAYPELFGNLDQYEISRYGSVIEKYYELYDQILGKYLASLKEVDLLVVYSSHGIEPLPLWRRFVEWVLGNIDLSAYHENAPDGTIFFYGNSVARGKSIEGIRLVDLAPTLLYYVGLPVGKDMDGIVRSSPFLRNFTAENPIFYISSYEDFQIQKP
jgi:predicted AlkP superfamily pyrophosphatase or phosphodiesterase